MAVAPGPFLAAVLLLISSGHHCSVTPPACPESCICERASLLNCSSSGLSLVPQHIHDSVTELDLSHNLLDSVTLHQPHRHLRNVWLGNNTITHLSLCIERYLGSKSVRGRHLHRLTPWSRGRCVSWAPALQLLSVERNQLAQLPEGLEGSPSLWVLQLSFNRISTLQSGDLSHLRQLKVLDLKHNLITSLHPEMFQDLAQLRVLDLSFNMLTSLHPLMYLSLRNIGTDVRLEGNTWHCDCSMRSLRRRMAYDSNRGLQAWNMVCAFPSIFSGKDLLQLEEDDLKCFGTENRQDLHHDVTVYSGSEILLSCTAQDSMWWTPNGQASASQPQAGLTISDVTERDAGLYVCMSEKYEVVSVYNLQISRMERAGRKTRSLPRTSRQVIPQDTSNRIGQERNQSATQNQLTLAVCLSVFITFLIAFILGILARPCIDVLWKKVTNKKSPHATNSVSSVEQSQYDNEAYSNGEETNEIVIHRERRVTFSTVDFGEGSNVQYYNTVPNGNQESIRNDAVIECEAAKAEEDKHTAGDSGSKNSLRQSSLEGYQRDGRDLSGITDAGNTHKMEFEHIQDPVQLEERRSLSSCSDSSLSDRASKEDRMTQGDHTTPKSPQLAENSGQERAVSTSRKVKVPKISIEDSIEIPGFSSEPFANWSPHTNNTSPTDYDPWQENEEQFEFSDSVRSTSARSSGVFDSFNDSKLIVVPNPEKPNSDDTSSSSSCVTENEPIQNTMNSDPEEEEAVDRNQNKSKVTNTCLKQDASFEEQIHDVDPVMPSVGYNQCDYRHDTQKPAEIPEHHISSHSSNSDGEQMHYTVKQEEKNTREKVKPMHQKKWRGLSLGVTSFGKSLASRAPSSPTAYSSSSSSDSEAEITDFKTKHNKSRVGQVKNHLDINSPLPASDSSSGDETMDETIKHTKKQKQEVDLTRHPIEEYQPTGYGDRYDAMKPHLPAPDLDYITTINRSLDIRAPSNPTDSFSSDESADQIDHMQKQKQGEMHMTRLPFLESQAESNDPDKRWPALELEHTKHIKRCPDIKAPPLPPDVSSNSDTENETTNPIKKLKQGEVQKERLPIKVSHIVSNDPQTQWPALDLEHIPHIKRHLDIKAPSPDSESSTSSDSGDETADHTEKQRPAKMDIAELQKSQRVSHDPDATRPTLDLEHIPRIKRHLDIKAPSPDSDSSTSSDSEDETADHTEKQTPAKVVISELQKSQRVSWDPEASWPAVDLEHIPHIKRRLDIKAPTPPPDSPSRTDNENETTDFIEKLKQGEVQKERLPIKVSHIVSNDPQTQWPPLDLEHIPHIKRRLDIKAPSPDSDSSTSSDSEDETADTTGKQRPAKVDVAELQKSQRVSHDPDETWPTLDLEHIPRIKRHLDIKAPSPDSDSSTSSDSEDETADHTEKQTPAKVVISELQKSQRVSWDPEASWPAVDLEHIPHIKRRLDIKAPTPPPDSPSRTDNENETTDFIEKLKQGEVQKERLPIKVSHIVSNDPQTQWPPLDLEHIPHIKRRLDIKAPSPDSDSSTSSDSEDETADHTEKQRPAKMDIAELQKSQRVSRDPDATWPTLDLEHIPRIKRHLDIRAPSPDSDSSTSSDSEDETADHTEKQRPAKVDVAELQKSQRVSWDPEASWPTVDLEHIPHIKRRLDIKAPTPPPDSPSRTDNENETTDFIKKLKQREVHKERLPIKVSHIVSNDPQTQWPALDLEHIPHIKRRLDIKAPSPDSDSSTSSDSEDETADHTEKQRPAKVDVAELQKSQRVSWDPEASWPAVDLEHIPHIKRRLDIKAPTPPPDSPSRTDNENETTDFIKKLKQREVHKERLPIKVSHIVSNDPQTQWPALDLEHIPHIKRRLDIKAPSPDSDSSTSSDSEDETADCIEKQRPAKVDIAELQKSQRVSHDPDATWPTLDLKHIPRIKRHLDIKAPSPDSDSSTSSDSEDETADHTEKQRPAKVDVAELRKSQRVSWDPDASWPAVDLEHIPHIKRRLDIKAPTPPPDSPSRTDNENETTDFIEKLKQGEVQKERLPIKVSHIVSNDPQTQWPALDLEHIPHIKRRLDIKAPSPDSDSSTSSDREDETADHTEKQRPAKVDIAELQKSQRASHDPDATWPTLDLEHIPRIKRHLDIRAPSPDSDSSTSSDSEDETTHLAERPGKVGIAELQLQKSQTVSWDPEASWPAVDLEHIPHIKRRLDIKAPSPDSDSSTTSDSGDETADYIEKQRPAKVDIAEMQKSQSVSHDPDAFWPTLDLEHIPGIKRRLDVKAPSPDSDSSTTSSVIEYETSHHTKKQRPRLGEVAGLPIKESHNIKLEKYTVITDDLGDKPTYDNISTVPEKSIKKNLGISHFRKRLEITSHTHVLPNLPKSPPPDSPCSSSSESGTGNKSSRTRLKRRGVGMQEILYSDSSLTLENKPVNVSQAEESGSMWPHLSLTNIPNIKRALDIKAPLHRESASSSNSEDEMVHRPSDLSVGVPRIKRRLNIKAPSSQPNFHSSCSESENELTGYTAKQSRHASNVSEMTNNDPQITYERLIMKDSLSLSNHFSPSGKNQTKDNAEMVHVERGHSHSVSEGDAFPTPSRVPRMSFDDIVKKRIPRLRYTTDVDLPLEKSHHLSDLSISSPRRRLDVGLLSPQHVSLTPERTPTDSSNFSIGERDDKIKQDIGIADVTLMHGYSSLSANSVSSASKRASEKFGKSSGSTNEILGSVSKDRRERIGLSALKVMSSARRKWDTEEQDLDKSASFDDHGPKSGTGFHYNTFEEDIKPLAKKPLTKFRPSFSSVDARSPADLLYDIPRYRSHDIGDAETRQETPPPIPATPPPDEAVESTWRSPPRSKTQGWEGTISYLQHSRNAEESDPSAHTSLYFDPSNPNISEV